MAIPPASVPGQPYPHPFREQGALASPEVRFEIDGATTRVIRWEYGGCWIRTDVRSRSKKHATAAEARAALDAMVTAQVAKGWAPLPAWPELPVPWRKVGPVAPPPLRRAPKPPAPLRMASLRVVGRKVPVKARDLAAFEAALKTEAPPSWADLLRTVGAGAFCNRFVVRAPDDAIRATKRFRKSWTDETLRRAFPEFGAKAAELVTVARSIDGDEVVFAAGKPGTLFILPRPYDTVVSAKGLSVVLAYFFRVARETDGVTAATYAPGKKL